jgi:hypothetical protein
LEEKDSKKNDALEDFNKNFLKIKKEYIDPKRRMITWLVRSFRCEHHFQLC